MYGYLCKENMLDTCPLTGNELLVYTYTVIYMNLEKLNIIKTFFKQISFTDGNFKLFPTILQ